jgi:hypothetical protein
VAVKVRGSSGTNLAPGQIHTRIGSENSAMTIASLFADCVM